eukprot:13827220-Alexandrium_andersonii.AAC.1
MLPRHTRLAGRLETTAKHCFRRFETFLGGVVNDWLQNTAQDTAQKRVGPRKTIGNCLKQL